MFKQNDEQHAPTHTHISLLSNNTNASSCRAWKTENQFAKTRCHYEDITETKWSENF